MTKGRTEAFSDGVFAVAATVLVFSIAVPDVKTGLLASALLAEWPSYAAYAISFSTIVVIWVNHHALTDLPGAADPQGGPCPGWTVRRQKGASPRA